jgi:hypothetical protein
VIQGHHTITLGIPVSLLDKAINAVPHVAYALGVVGIGAAVAIPNLILGLNRLAFLAIASMFLAMLLLYIFSRIERTRELIVKLAGQLIIIITALAFVAFVASSVAATILCAPRTFVFMYGCESACWSGTTGELIKLLNQRADDITKRIKSDVDAISKKALELVGGLDSPSDAHSIAAQTEAVDLAHKLESIRARF